MASDSRNESVAGGPNCRRRGGRPTAFRRAANRRGGGSCGSGRTYREEVNLCQLYEILFWRDAGSASGTYRLGAARSSFDDGESGVWSVDSGRGRVRADR
ncbi:hypothetical protein [Halorussus salinisoli]|uniref:hypothetical protein n=1 Tax=Halorussus salinisoli TaxID=2558242 RepID=UPI0010C1E105|nr:hypothetical protein [Halorussus salinisoli]